MTLLIYLLQVFMVGGAVFLMGGPVWAAYGFAAVVWYQLIMDVK